jgi:transposase InsO family protein
MVRYGHAGRRTPSCECSCVSSPISASASATAGCFVLLRRQGEPSGITRIYRLYRKEGLIVRKRCARRHAVGARAPILVEAKPNARWSLDFVHDQFACGRRFRILNIVDDVTRSRITDWVDDYNDQRPHSALGYLPSGLHRQSCRDMRSASGPAPPIACCPTRA